jgi:exportin-2 (importin alpha re-exporter)
MAAAVDPNTLRNSLQQTLSPDATTRKAAEKFLDSVSAQAGFIVAVLQLLESNTELPEVRLAAALLFKNFIRRSWDPEKDKTVAPADREIVKQHIVELMCRVPDAIRNQLIEALVTIGEYDFPDQWESLLPQLVQKLHTQQDWQVRNGVLLTANTLFKRFRHVFRSDSLYAELKKCLEAFQVRCLRGLI